jgi:EmrB/QacA subfamily drug resistance transporter
MTGAVLGDRLGRRRVFVTGLGLFTIASAACALAPTTGWLIIARAAQGAGAALVMPLAMALLSAAFPREERGKALGIFSGVTGLALVGGPVAGGAIAQSLAWQWIFWLNVPIGVITILLALGRIPESKGPGRALDIPGLVLVTGAALAAVWALIRGNPAGWTSPEVVAAGGAAIFLCAAFIIWQLRAREPMISMRLFRSPAFSSGNAAVFFLSGSLQGTLFFLAQFLQTAQGHGPFGAGVRLLPWTAILFVVAPVAGAVMNRTGERPLVAGGLLLQTVGMAWIGRIASPGVPYAALVPPLIVAGIGASMAIPAAQNAVLSSVEAAEVGKASGTFNMLRFLGGVFGIAILAAVFARTGSFGSAGAFSAGFGPAIGASAALSLLGAAAGMWQPARRDAALVATEAA